jgi:probable F420-dependent oxidoreductase
MHIGLVVAPSDPFATAEYLAGVVEAAEARGFHSIWVPEHVVFFDDYASHYPYSEDGRAPLSPDHGVLEPFTTLAVMAAHSSRIRLGTGILLLPQRNPVYTAKEAAAVDWLSKGRLDLGVGIGWLAEEFEALGVPFAGRANRCREYVEVLRTLWCDPVSEFHGEFYDLPACRQYPKPIQQPHPPIHFGGESDAALRRVAEVGNGWYGFNLDPERLAERLALLDRLLEACGRTRDDVMVSVSSRPRGVDADRAKQFADLGVDQLIVGAFGAKVDDVVRRLDHICENILDPTRS